MTRTRKILLASLATLLLGSVIAQAHGYRRLPPFHFVPDSFAFWDFSRNWTTNYGPAYRDTVPDPSYFLPCTGRFALCFHSGPEPLPCTLTEDGRFADCTCDVGDSLNYVLMTAILNDDVYKETVKACGHDGRRCHTPDSAPVCQYLKDGRLIPGADVISDFAPDATGAIHNAIDGGSPPFTNCNGPFAGCMTAPCTLQDDGTAVCSCPVFCGRFQLTGADQSCNLGDHLVPSASYTPALDPNLP
jgi:hypothetical protein